MKILHISLADKGGAGLACTRLHVALLNARIDSKVLVLDRYFDHMPEVDSFGKYDSDKIRKAKFFLKRHLPPALNSWKIAGRNDEFEGFSNGKSWFRLSDNPLAEEADILHIHHAAEFLNFEEIPDLGKPIVLTCHDMNPITGGCHHAFDCTKFKSQCKDCPQLEGSKDANYSLSIQKRKIRAIRKTQKIEIITPSHWLKKAAESSAIIKGLNVHCIPHGLNRKFFRRQDKIECRNILNLPVGRKLLLFVCEDYKRINKGAWELSVALKEYLSPEDFDLILLGSTFPEKYFEPFRTYEIGKICNENFLQVVYSAADAVVVPSHYESFSWVSLEAIACHRPVAAFDNSGPAEIIEHGKTGFLADFKNISHLASSIDKSLNFQGNIDLNEKYSANTFAQNHIKIYKEMMANG